MLVMPVPARADYRSALSAYQNGSYEQAVREFTALAGQGDPRGFYHLALMHRDGLGVGQDPVMALALLLCVGDVDGEIGPSAGRWRGELMASLDGAAVAAAQRAAAAACPEAQPAGSRSGLGEAPERTVQRDSQGESTGRTETRFELGNLVDALIDQGHGANYGASPRGQGTATVPEGQPTSPYVMPSRRSSWSKWFFLPGDATIVGSQYIALKIRAERLLREMRQMAREDNKLVIGIFSAIWWALIVKILVSVARSLIDIFRIPSDGGARARDPSRRL